MSPHIAAGRQGELAVLAEGAGAVLVLVGAYSPWARTFVLFTSASERGVDATCLGTTCRHLLPLIPLVVLGLLAWRWYVRRAVWAHLVILALGAVTLALALAYVIGLQARLARAEQSLSQVGQLPGTVRVDLDIGPYLTVAGGAAMAAGGLLGSKKDRLPRRSPENSRRDRESSSQSLPS